jgi:hypothetical protein
VVAEQEMRDRVVVVQVVVEQVELVRHQEGQMQ